MPTPHAVTAELQVTALSRPQVRNSDAETFAACRRKWYFASAHHWNLMPPGNLAPLWLGTGFHFALEDYHGYQRYPTAISAWTAYLNCFTEAELPPDWQHLDQMATSMLGYYTEHWVFRHQDDVATLWVDGVPQVEVRWSLPIPGTEVDACGTFDRVCVDSYGRLVLMDYKTYARFDFEKLEMDRQCTTYLWAATQLYPDQVVTGLQHVQFHKGIAQQPAVLKNGKFSQAKDQTVTHDSYQSALLDKYGLVPQEYQSFLTYLAGLEDADGDGLIARRLVTRPPAHLAHHELALGAQYNEMLSEATALYPSPGIACRTCPFKQPCLAIDQDADWQDLLRDGYVSRTTSDDWRLRLELPDGTPYGGAL